MAKKLQEAEGHVVTAPDDNGQLAAHKIYRVKKEVTIEVNLAQLKRDMAAIDGLIAEKTAEKAELQALVDEILAEPGQGKV